jgi:hypothetical protein
MTGHIIVPLCASIDAFGFRIMCTGPVDSVDRRLLIGRDDLSSDLKSCAGAAAHEGASVNVPVHYVTLDLRLIITRFQQV